MLEMNQLALRIAFAVALMGGASCAFAADKYLQAEVDRDGQLRIVLASGRTFVPAKNGDQVGFAKPQISPDRRTVGWLAEFPSYSTSYSIPLKLVIYSNGAARTFTGSGVPIWAWGFQAEGRQFAFSQETLHGGLGIHFELHDTRTGRLIEEYTPQVGPDNQILPGQTYPAWTKELNQ